MLSTAGHCDQSRVAVAIVCAPSFRVRQAGAAVPRITMRPKSAVAAGVHFFYDELATVGLLDASLYSRAEAGLIFEHAGNSVFHQLLGVLAIGRGHLLEPRFNVGREMYFHSLQGTGKPGRGQGPCTA